MKQVRRWPKVGDMIHIFHMFGEPEYAGRDGVVRYIDDMDQIHGTWGGCALVSGDDFVVLEREDKDNDRFNQ
jgi:hypothetical protein